MLTIIIQLLWSLCILGLLGTIGLPFIILGLWMLLVILHTVVSVSYASIKLVKRGVIKCYEMIKIKLSK